MLHRLSISGIVLAIALAMGSFAYSTKTAQQFSQPPVITGIVFACGYPVMLHNLTGNSEAFLQSRGWHEMDIPPELTEMFWDTDILMGYNLEEGEEHGVVCSGEQEEHDEGMSI